MLTHIAKHGDKIIYGAFVTAGSFTLSKLFLSGMRGGHWRTLFVMTCFAGIVLGAWLAISKDSSGDVETMKHRVAAYGTVIGFLWVGARFFS